MPAAGARIFYWLKDRLRPLGRLLPSSLRKRIYLYVVNRAISELPARTFLAKDVVPALQKAGCRRLLIVGTQSYNLPLYELCKRLGMSIKSIDIDPAAAVFGAPDGNFVGDVRHLANLVGPDRFDGIIFNGVLGFGINTASASAEVVRAFQAVGTPGAIVVVGWNPGLSSEAEIDAFRRKLAPARLAGLEAAAEFPPTMPIQPTPHRYEFFRLG